MVHNIRLRIMFQDLGFSIQGSGFRAKDLRLKGLGFRIYG